MSEITVAVAQFAPTPDRPANRTRVVDLINKAAADNAQLIIVPEYASFCARELGPDFAAHSESLDGPFVTDISRAAHERGVWVIAGLVESSDERDRFSNTLVAVSPNGDVATTYRKQHLYDAFGARESEWVTPGPLLEPTLIDVGGFAVGMQTCYDLRFPEVSRTLVNAGAELIAVPAQWIRGPLKEAHWSTLIAARAIENTVFVAASDQGAPLGIGQSRIVDPTGVTLAGVGSTDGTALATLNHDTLVRVRTENPVLTARRYRVCPN